MKKLFASALSLLLLCGVTLAADINPKDPPFNAKCDGVTDDLLALQAAANATPVGETLRIPPSNVYSSTGHYIGGCAISNTININQPINIDGGGMYSNIKPLPSFPPTAPNIQINQSGTYWFGITFSNFGIGDDTIWVPYNRYGGAAIATNAISIPHLRFINLDVGESGNDYSLKVTGSGTQGTLIKENRICGGIFLDVADSTTVKDNKFCGRSQKGIYINTSGAGGFLFNHNVITAVGGVIFMSGSLPVISDNYWEELSGFPFTGTAAITGVNAALALSSQVSQIRSAQVLSNIFNMGQGTGYNVYIAATTLKTNISGTISNVNTNRPAIYNNNATTVCGPSDWLGRPGPYFEPLAPASTYGGC